MLAVNLPNTTVLLYLGLGICIVYLLCVVYLSKTLIIEVHTYKRVDDPSLN